MSLALVISFGILTIGIAATIFVFAFEEWL